MERGGENSALMKILSYFAKHTLKQNLTFPSIILVGIWRIFHVILEFENNSSNWLGIALFSWWM